MKPYKKYPEECEQIIEVCRNLYKKNMLSAADGNVSVRVDDGVLITPSGKSKARMDRKEIAMVSLDNEILYGDPSSERLMHLTVYRNNSAAQAVVHAHPTTAIAWSVAFPLDRELPNNCLSELVLAAGSIPIVAYARPGTLAMGEALIPYIENHKIMILSRHGGLAWGDSLDEAAMGMERLEHSAEILYKAFTLNGLSYIDDNEMAALLKLRAQGGNRTI